MFEVSKKPTYKTDSTMQDILIPALHEAFAKVNSQVPATKRSTASIDISDVNPVDLSKFMLDNNVPSNAYFDGNDDGYDGWCVGQVKLTWDINIPTTLDDHLKFKRKRFQSVAWHTLYPLLLDAGYKRISSGSDKFRKFDGATLYDRYTNGDFDTLVDYYSLSFKKDLT